MYKYTSTKLIYKITLLRWVQSTALPPIHIIRLHENNKNLGEKKTESKWARYLNGCPYPHSNRKLIRINLTCNVSGTSTNKKMYHWVIVLLGIFMICQINGQLKMNLIFEALFHLHNILSSQKFQPNSNIWNYVYVCFLSYESIFFSLIVCTCA